MLIGEDKRQNAFVLSYWPQHEANVDEAPACCGNIREEEQLQGQPAPIKGLQLLAPIPCVPEKTHH
jgi:hypothetical protein